ncbi:MAG: IS4 family transposase [Candidatus Paceibacterales bacterium]
MVGIGRVLETDAKVKHAIKRVDRLFGNRNLQARIENYYQDIIRWIVKNNNQPIILIDWSGLTNCGKFHFLRASVPVGGRALPILDMAFPQKQYGSQKAHKQFIKQLKKILPKTCCPIVVTDAGFRCPWFKLIRSFGWHFVGRVRHLTQYSLAEKGEWSPIKTLYEKASLKPKYLFSAFLAKNNSVRCEFYIVRQRKKHRVKKNLAGKKVQCSVSKKHAKSGREPWLIVSSLPTSLFSAQQIMSIYKKRMQIEESIRDLKNTKNGLGIRHSRSYKLGRLNVSLLLGAIAILVLWILGGVAKQKEEHWSFQTNSVRSKNILSNFTIGWQMIARHGPKCSNTLFFKSIEEIAVCAASY